MRRKSLVILSAIAWCCAAGAGSAPPNGNYGEIPLADGISEPAARGPCVVGYGYSPQHLPHPDQQMFLRGFESGLGQKDDSFSTVLAMDLESSVDGVAWAASLLADAGAIAIAGFPRSAEALPAVSVGRSRGITMLLPGSGDPILSQMGPGVYSTGGTMRGAVEDTLDFIYQRFSDRRGVVVYRDASSINRGGRQEIDAWLAGKGDRGDKYKPLQDRLTAVVLQEQLRFRPEDLEEVRASDYLVLTVQPLEAVALLDQLERAGLNLPLIVVSSWTTGDAAVVRRWLANKEQAVYSMGVMVLGATTTCRFEQIVEQERIAQGQLSYFAHGFDVGVVVRKTLDRLDVAGAPATPTTFRTALAMSTEFEDVSTDSPLRLPPEGGQADRPTVYVRYTDDGDWELIEDMKSPSQLREQQRVTQEAERVRESSSRDPSDA